MPGIGGLSIGLPLQKISASDVVVNPIPANAILDEDGNPLRDEDGNILLRE